MPEQSILKSHKILVTGCAGFIGSHLIEKLLDMNQSVTGIDNFDPFYARAIKEKNLENATSRENFLFFEGDILDAVFLDQVFKETRPDMVIHLAARAGVGPSLSYPRDYFNTNIMGTLNILEAMKKSDVKQLIFASSSSIYGNSPKVPFHEEDPVDRPISPYAASKRAGELICYTYHQLYAFDIYCLRFFTVYGPRQRPDLAIRKFSQNILKQIPIKLYGNGLLQRDFTYVDDTVGGILLAAGTVKGFEIINIGNSQTVNLLSLVKHIEEEAGVKAIVEFLEAPPGDVTLTYADISKANSMLGYNPGNSLRHGIHQYFNWLRTNSPELFK